MRTDRVRRRRASRSQEPERVSVLDPSAICSHPVIRPEPGRCCAVARLAGAR